MSTIPLYLDDSYLYECDAKIEGVCESEDGRHSVILDRTIFYPKGGGQPADHGTITSDICEFAVDHVAKDKETLKISHFGKFSSSAQNPFASGTSVKCIIDKNRRLLNCRYHLAGHLLDLAVIHLGVYEDWESLSGNHSPEAAYVEFRVASSFSPERVTAAMIKMEETCNALIKKNLKSYCQNFRPSEVPDCAQKMLTDQMKGMVQIRINKIEGEDSYWMPCGGTLCDYLGEIGQMTIPKYSFKKGLLRICYKLTTL